MSIIEDIARRAREAQEDAAERRWIKSMMEAIDVIIRRADEASSYPRELYLSSKTLKLKRQILMF